MEYVILLESRPKQTNCKHAITCVKECEQEFDILEY